MSGSDRTVMTFNKRTGSHIGISLLDSFPGGGVSALLAKIKVSCNLCSSVSVLFTPFMYDRNAESHLEIQDSSRMLRLMSSVGRYFEALMPPTGEATSLLEVLCDKRSLLRSFTDDSV